MGDNARQTPARRRVVPDPAHGQPGVLGSAGTGGARCGPSEVLAHLPQSPVLAVTKFSVLTGGSAFLSNILIVLIVAIFVTGLVMARTYRPDAAGRLPADREAVTGHAVVNPGGGGALLHEAVVVEDQHTVWLAELCGQVRLEIVADAVGVPPAVGERVLQAVTRRRASTRQKRAAVSRKSSSTSRSQAFVGRSCMTTTDCSERCHYMRRGHTLGERPAQDRPTHTKPSPHSPPPGR